MPLFIRLWLSHTDFVPPSCRSFTAWWHLILLFCPIALRSVFSRRRKPSLARSLTGPRLPINSLDTLNDRARGPQLFAGTWVERTKQKERVLVRTSTCPFPRIHLHIQWRRSCCHCNGAAVQLLEFSRDVSWPVPHSRRVTLTSLFLLLHTGKGQWINPKIRFNKFVSLCSFCLLGIRRWRWLHVRLLFGS